MDTERRSHDASARASAERRRCGLYAAAVMDEHLADVLRCSTCGAPYVVGSAHLECPHCEARFPIVDGIPVLLTEATVGTMLDQFDYNALMGIDEDVVLRNGIQWKKLVARLGIVCDDALEVGAGTGALTLGLLNQKVIRRVVATDVSLKFVGPLADRVEQDAPVSFVVCDMNTPHFRAGAFDVVFGRSVLHHLLDYEDTLRQCCTALKPGGAAIFEEPVLEGVMVTVLGMALMLQCDEMVGGGRLSPTDREKIGRQIRHQLERARLAGDREALAELEDKYIFRIDELTAAGRRAGFASVEFVSGNLEFGYWAYVTHSCKVLGIPAEHVRPYEWIGREFTNTYGLMFPEAAVAPIGFFVFRR